MTEEHKRQLEAFFTNQLGDGWQHRPFISLDGMEVVEALWPINQLFRQHHALIGSIRYSAQFEKEADAALKLFVEGGTWTSDAPSAGAWRVLMERHIQSMTVALANHVQGNKRVMSIPQGLPIPRRTPAAMLWLQWAMVLPFPVEDRASYEWPEASAADKLSRH